MTFTVVYAYPDDALHVEGFLTFLKEYSHTDECRARMVQTTSQMSANYILLSVKASCNLSLPCRDRSFCDVKRKRKTCIH